LSILTTRVYSLLLAGLIKDKNSHTHISFAMYRTICISAILILMLVLTCIEATAQESSHAHEDNEGIVLSEIQDLIRQSEIIRNLNQPFRFSSNIPDRSRMIIFQQLLDMDKQVRLGNENMGKHLQLMIYSENSLRQIDRDLADRTLSAEVQLYLSDEDQNLSNTEKFTFKYSDQVPFNLRSELEGDWTAVRFQDTHEIPVTNRWRTYGQPAIIVAATGVTVFLLFNLRSS